MTTNSGTIYLPKQHVKRGRGKPGYKGKNIKVVSDPAAAYARDAARAAEEADEAKGKKK